jgi:hypothetical protein
VTGAGRPRGGARPRPPGHNSCPRQSCRPAPRRRRAMNRRQPWRASTSATNSSAWCRRRETRRTRAGVGTALRPTRLRFRQTPTLLGLIALWTLLPHADEALSASALAFLFRNAQRPCHLSGSPSQCPRISCNATDYVASSRKRHHCCAYLQQVKIRSRPIVFIVINDSLIDIRVFQGPHI